MRIVAACMILLAQAGAQPKPADGFAAWFAQFQAAAVRNDGKTVAAGVRWPINWENGPTREIKTEADLARRFDFYFTPEIRKNVARGKPEKYGNPPTYSITWKARGNEYSIYFRQDAGKWALDGLSEGPP